MKFPRCWPRRRDALGGATSGDLSAPKGRADGLVGGSLERSARVSDISADRVLTNANQLQQQLVWLTNVNDTGSAARFIHAPHLPQR